MPIPESQLSTWCNSGDTKIAIDTHTSVRYAIEIDRRLKGRKLDIYLQGSYKNDTNTWGDGDVDIVVELVVPFYPDISGLSPNDQTSLKETQRKAAEYWESFRYDVFYALQDYYRPENINPGNKAIKLKKAPGKLGADIVLCLQYRRYQQQGGRISDSYVPGIWFRSRLDNNTVINYPKLHYDNGVKKQEETGGLFKPTIRMFKNARMCLIDRHIVDKELAPSYFLQCLLYNVPVSKFSTSRQTTYNNIVTWLQTASFTSFVCQNGQQPLFGNTPQQWTIDKAERLRNAFIKLWNEWT